MKNLSFIQSQKNVIIKRVITFYPQSYNILDFASQTIVLIKLTKLIMPVVRKQNKIFSNKMHDQILLEKKKQFQLGQYKGFY